MNIKSNNFQLSTFNSQLSTKKYGCGHETEEKEEGESFLFFVYIGRWDLERRFHRQTYEDDCSCRYADIYFYR